jgi:membrane peptidoglycan carboxypeptidase
VNGERGTARRVHLNDIEIAGKTGTSQVVGRKDSGDEYTPPHLRPHAWFVCYAPFDNPKIAVAVVVENGEHGSSAAGPIAREMVKTYLRKAANGQKVASGGIKVVIGGNGQNCSESGTGQRRSKTHSLAPNEPFFNVSLDNAANALT